MAVAQWIERPPSKPKTPSGVLVSVGEGPNNPLLVAQLGSGNMGQNEGPQGSIIRLADLRLNAHVLLGNAVGGVGLLTEVVCP